MKQLANQFLCFRVLDVWVLRLNESKFSEDLMLLMLGSTDFWFDFGFGFFFSSGASLITMSQGYASYYFRRICFLVLLSSNCTKGM